VLFRSWSGTPEIKRIIWLVVPEASNRQALLQSGKVDVAEGLSPEQITALNSQPGVKAAAVRSNTELFAVMNNKMEPFSNPKVRQAVNYLIPRDKIAEEIYRGLAQPWAGVFPVILDGYTDFYGHGGYAYNPEKAKQLLAEAGYPDGLKVKLAFSAGDPVQEQVAIALKNSLAEGGIEVTPEKTPPAAVQEMVTGHKAPFALWQDAPFLPDTNFAAGLWFKSGVGPNFQEYSNPQIDALIDEGGSIVDFEKRVEFHKQIQEIVFEEAAQGWIVAPHWLMGVRDRVEGFNWDPAQIYRVEYMSLKQ
jgi:peptide/nickel transport system substrate-binding protein